MPTTPVLTLLANRPHSAVDSGTWVVEGLNQLLFRTCRTALSGEPQGDSSSRLPSPKTKDNNSVICFWMSGGSDPELVAGFGAS
eukprot:14659353-Alexandrium_andersonii.AAC.1